MPDHATTYGDLWRMTACRLRDGFIDGSLSPVEVLDAHLSRIDALDPELNAFVTRTTDLARATARAAERAYADGGDVPPMLGIPIAIKDNLATAGIRTTMGSRLLADWVPGTDAVIVERVRRAGGVVLGKTNTSEFGWKGEAGNPLFGPTRNPWRRDRTSGGSSGGSAAAVAAGFAPVALGTDGAGSLRIPGSFCGVVGFKPSQGTVPVGPRGGVGTLSHHGPLARSLEDIALVLSVAAGPDARDRLADSRADRDFGVVGDPRVAGLRVGWSPTLGYAVVEPEVLSAVTRAVAAFTELGCEVDEVDVALDDPHDLVWRLFSLAQATQHAEDHERVRDLVDPGRLAMIDAGFALSAVDIGLAMAARDRFHQQVQELMHDWDVLVTPTMPQTAFEPGLDHPPTYAGGPTDGYRWSPFTYPFNLTGQPAVTLPCGTVDGLPVGIQIVGRWRDDETVLHLAAAFERARPWPALAPDRVSVPDQPR